MFIIDIIKSNNQISQLTKSLAEMTTDRDLQLTKLAEFEVKNKEYIESAQSADAMQENHKQEIFKLKAEYEAKLVEKDKTITTTKESVVSESIALVASQGTTAVIESVVPAMTLKGALEKMKSLSPAEAQKFYSVNKQIFEGYIKNPQAV